jgi:hypothetical protein
MSPEQLAHYEANPDATISAIDAINAIEDAESKVSTFIFAARHDADPASHFIAVSTRIDAMHRRLELETIRALRVPYQKVPGQLLPPIDQSLRFPSVNPDVATSDDPQPDASADPGHSSKEEDDDGNAEARTRRPC